MGLLKILAQFQEIVDFAVKSNSKCLRGILHRLVTARREIQNREPPAAQSDAISGGTPKAGVVRAAVSQTISHSHGGCCGQARAMAYRPYDSAHWRVPFWSAIRRP